MCDLSGQIISKKQIHKGDIKFLHNMDNKLLISGEIFQLLNNKFVFSANREFLV